MSQSRDTHPSLILEGAQTDRQPSSHESAVPGPTRSGKRPYQQPTYRFERVFETMALSCGKVQPVEFQCRFNRKNS